MDFVQFLQYTICFTGSNFKCEKNQNTMYITSIRNLNLVEYKAQVVHDIYICKMNYA